MPIVPIVLSTYHSIYDAKKWLFEGGTVKAKVLKPISTVGLNVKDVDDLIAKTRSVMLETLKEISSENDADVGKLCLKCSKSL